MRIRPWQKSDIDEISRIESFSFSDPWTRENLLDVLRYPHYRSFLVEEGGHVLGYACLIVTFDMAEVADIAVASPFRGRGVGKALMDVMHADAKRNGVKECLLEVRVSNAKAISLYEKCGYVAYGTRPRYYGNEDALLMRKSL